jgi:hypothetical protein
LIHKLSSLAEFDVEGNTNITRVSLRSSVLTQTALAAIVDGSEDSCAGIGELLGVMVMLAGAVALVGLLRRGW